LVLRELRAVALALDDLDDPHGVGKVMRWRDLMRWRQPSTARPGDVAGGEGDLAKGSGGAPPGKGTTRRRCRRGGQPLSETPSPPAGASPGRAVLTSGTGVPGWSSQPCHDALDEIREALAGAIRHLEHL